jgi:hypothetical protein
MAYKGMIHYNDRESFNYVVKQLIEHRFIVNDQFVDRNNKPLSGPYKDIVSVDMVVIVPEYDYIGLDKIDFFPNDNAIGEIEET